MYHRPRTPRGCRVRRVERIALQNFDPIDIDGQNLVRHLSISRLMSLAVRMRAYSDFDVAVRGEPHIGLLITGNDRPSPCGEDRSSVRALFQEERQTQRS